MTFYQTSNPTPQCHLFPTNSTEANQFLEGKITRKNVHHSYSSSIKCHPSNFPFLSPIGVDPLRGQAIRHQWNIEIDWDDDDWLLNWTLPQTHARMAKGHFQFPLLIWENIRPVVFESLDSLSTSNFMENFISPSLLRSPLKTLIVSTATNSLIRKRHGVSRESISAYVIDDV